MRKTYEFPRIFNARLVLDLIRRCRLQIKNFNTAVVPLLIQFDVYDDEHIRKYLNADSFEDIYRDITKERGTYLRFYQATASARNEDFWKLFREIGCEKNTRPGDPGFKFKPMPNCFGNDRQLILSSITVADRELKFDEKRLENAAVFHPSAQQQELFDLCSEFCEKLQTLGVSKTAQQLFAYDKQGRLIPSGAGILGYY